jgi:hypothetical protein
MHGDTAGLVAGGIVKEGIPAVELKLKELADKLHSAAEVIIPAIEGIAGKIIEGDLELLLEIVSHFEICISELEEELVKLLDTVGEGLSSQLKSFVIQLLTN